jgi:hypothetical protein
MSPRPVAPSIPSAGDGKLTTGTIVRAIRFQRSLSVNGMTGWMLR